MYKGHVLSQLIICEDNSLRVMCTILRMRVLHVDTRMVGCKLVLAYRRYGVCGTKANIDVDLRVMGAQPSKCLHRVAQAQL